MFQSKGLECGSLLPLFYQKLASEGSSLPRDSTQSDGADANYATGYVTAGIYEEHKMIKAIIATTAILVASSTLAAQPPGNEDNLVTPQQFGARGDGESLDTKPVQKAIDNVSKVGGTVFFPPGKYLCGTLVLKSNVTLYLSTGAVLLGSTDIKDYPEMIPSQRSYTDNYARHSLIYGEGVENVALMGHGVIDGQGAAFRWKEYKNRPFAIRMIECREIVVEGLTLRNSAMWMQHYLNCENLRIHSIRVSNLATYNNDGLDLDGCRNAVVSGCIMETDDDALVLKSTFDRPSEDITITNCVLSSHCNALKMGTESNGGFKNIAISNCVIHSPRNPSYFFGSQRGSSGISLEIVDGGTLDGIAISNIAIEGVSVPLFLRLGNRARPFISGGPKPEVGKLENVTIQNITARNVSKVGCSITGLPGHPIRNVSLSDIQFEFEGGGNRQDARQEVPEKPTDYPEATMFGTLPAYGFYCRHVEGLTLRNADVRTAQPDERPALICDDVRILKVEAFSGYPPETGLPLMVFKDVEGGWIQGCLAKKATNVFLQLQGTSRDISVMNNDLSRSRTPFHFEAPAAPAVLFETANRLP
jgi:polygalacturonase